MARSVSTVCELFKANEPSAAQTPVALTANTAVYIPTVGRNVIIGITPAANGTVKVYKGDGVAAMNDITFAVTKDKISFVELDTSSFGIIDAEDENVGSIKLECSAAGTLVAVNAL
jgi:hypothetical protein